MEYRHKWNQFFRKKLNLPKRILSKVYNDQLYLREYIEYELYGKIPVSCIQERDKKILDKFGIEKLIALDWELIESYLGVGVGIENWVLQHGGSFIDAARTFVKAAEGLTYDEFKDKYKVWDFGENHLAAKKGTYPHDNFIFDNMSEIGFKKTREALKKYLQTYKQVQNNTIRR